MFCPSCGKQIEDDSVFCPECGARVKVGAAGDGAADATVVRERPFIAGQSAEPVGATEPAGAKKGGAPVPVIAALVAAVVVVGVVCGAVVIPRIAQANSDSAAQQQAADQSMLTIQVSGNDASACPAVVATLRITDGAGEPSSGLAATDFSVTEKGSDGSNASATVRDLVSNGGGTYQLTFQSNIPAGSTSPRSVTIAPAGSDRTWDAVGFTYNPPAPKEDKKDEKKDDSSSKSSDASSPTKVVVVQPVVEHIDSADYILPNSDKVYYSSSDFGGLSDWELYVARNEIFARHGRAFRNADLARYFSRKSWYVPRYSSEEFDSMPSPLNDYEKKNADALLAYEKSIGSQYLH